MSKSKKTLIITSLAFVTIAMVVVLSISVTRAFMDLNTTPVTTNVGIQNCAKIKLNDSSSTAISLNNTFPMTRNAALANVTPYTFTVSSTCTNLISFDIYIGTASSNTLANNKVRYILTNHGSTSSLVEGILSSATNSTSLFTNEELQQYSTGSGNTINTVYTIKSDNLPLGTTKTFDLYLFIDSAVSDSMNQTFNAAIAVKSFDRNVTATKFETKILADNTTVIERNDFTTTNSANTTGTIYTTDRTDDDSTVYYYSGNTTKNWVVFGDNGNGTYYYWRIIRTNSDEEGNGVRLLYSGSGSSASTIPNDLVNGFIGTSAFNENNDKSEYAGYMYTIGEQHGHSASSTMKTAVESWYTSSGLENFETYINQDAVYCNDRSVATGTTWTSAPGSDFDYAGKVRLDSNKYPTLKCGGDTSGGYYESASNRLADKFSKTNTVGNGYLSKPIGLMTTDELVLAGGMVGTALDSPYAWYYNNGSGTSIIGSGWWWLLTPKFWYATNQKPSQYLVDAYDSYYGRINASNIANTGSSKIRPVISLKTNVVVSGTGTTASPYIIEGLQ